MSEIFGKHLENIWKIVLLFIVKVNPMLWIRSSPSHFEEERWFPRFGCSALEVS